MVSDDIIFNYSIVLADITLYNVRCVAHFWALFLVQLIQKINGHCCNTSAYKPTCF